jgi:hypothetical protein
VTWNIRIKNKGKREIEKWTTGIRSNRELMRRDKTSAMLKTNDNIKLRKSQGKRMNDGVKKVEWKKMRKRTKRID